MEKKLKSTVGIISLALLLVVTTAFDRKKPSKHLFILSGQSNMARLIPEESFLPTVVAAFGKENVLVVRDAMGTQPIRRWYKDWKPAEGNEPKADPALYDSLMKKVRAATRNERIASVTFIWMQGERDAREKHGDVYKQSLLGLYRQVCSDLGRNDVNMVIGRLSDFGLQNEQYPHWNLIRQIQVEVADSDPRFDWVDTDDLNDGKDRDGVAINNDLHMSGEGYKILGSRFAEKAIALIERNKGGGKKQLSKKFAKRL